MKEQQLFLPELMSKVYKLNPLYAMWAADQFLETFIQDKKIDCCIEIGRCNGISTLILAKYSRMVYTFDVANHNQELIWAQFPNLRKKIYSFTGAQPYIDFTLAELKAWAPQWQLDFNFCFIDGEHAYDAVKHDYDLTSWSNRVLFHDAHGWEVGKFLEEIGGEVVSPCGVYGYKEVK